MLNELFSISALGDGTWGISRSVFGNRLYLSMHGGVRIAERSLSGIPTVIKIIYSVTIA
jgi:hypothetical protein